jgi:hypothetical protein
MNEFCVACGDHLLPKRLYPALEQTVDNLVASCANCNVIKKDYDPSDGKGLEIILTESVRRTLIDKNSIESCRPELIDVERAEVDRRSGLRPLWNFSAATEAKTSTVWARDSKGLRFSIISRQRDDSQTSK